jgi:repressor LexA
MLTKKQKEIYDYIVKYINDEGVSPTQKEIKEYFGFKSFGSVQRYLRYLQDHQLISNEWNARRGIQLNKSNKKTNNTLPIMGNIAAGIPIEAIEHNDEIEVPPHLYNPRKTNFCLQVNGDSMIEKGIMDGDIVIIEQRKTAEQGEIIAAIIDNEATLKIMKKEKGQIKLIAANRKYKPISVKEDLKIAGVLVGLLRSY